MHTYSSVNSTIYQFPLGPMDNFVYIVVCNTTKSCAMVDPAWDTPKLLRFIEEHQLNLEHIWVTHAHHDHVNGLEHIPNLSSLNVYCDTSLLTSSRYLPSQISLTAVQHSQSLPLGNLTVMPLFTPGHAPDHFCFMVDNMLLTGDALFVNGCGRCDLQNSNVHDMANSLFDVIAILPNDTIILPGHNYGSTPSDNLKNQKLNNRFLSSESKDIFIKKRMRT